eukprot:s892_g11.t1
MSNAGIGSGSDLLFISFHDIERRMEAFEEAAGMGNSSMPVPPGPSPAPQEPREARSPETDCHWSQLDDGSRPMTAACADSEASTRCATAEKATVVTKVEMQLPPADPMKFEVLSNGLCTCPGLSLSAVAMDNASGRVQVWARVRPPIEQDHGPCHAVDCIDKTVRVRNDAEAVERMLGQADTSPSPEPKEFAFDGVFGESSAQRDVFMQIGLPVLREALRGINGTILAYGQTGSGKTHSLLHQSSKGEEAGLLPRLVASLFLMISQDVANVYDVEAAAVQAIAFKVYNEQVDDLLNPDHQSGQGASSRSHAIFQLRISKRERVFEAAKTGQKVECTIARLNVVDLAGSERVKKILDGSIGGNCRTALLVCVNPAFEHVGETLNTLEFASRAMRVEAE